MKSVDILRQEHAMIRVVLDEIRKTAERIVRNEQPPREYLDGVLDFCRGFADHFHHYKEEHLMFGLLAQKYDGGLDVQLEKHRAQHEQLRDLLGEISGSVDGYYGGSCSAAQNIHRTLVDYAARLLSHIRSEEEVFFRLVEQSLSEFEDQRLVTEFGKYEAGEGGALREAYRQRVVALCEASRVALAHSSMGLK